MNPSRSQPCPLCGKPAHVEFQDHDAVMDVACKTICVRFFVRKTALKHIDDSNRAALSKRAAESAAEEAFIEITYESELRTELVPRTKYRQ